MCHQDALNGVVVQHLPIRLGVVDRRKSRSISGVVRYGDCETHLCGAAHVIVHHLQDFREARAVGLEVLNVKLFVIV